MNDEQKQPLFLERRSYHQRRLYDVARVIPLLGIVLWLIPLMGDDGLGNETSANSVRYVFGVWIVLIVLSAAVSWRLRPSTTSDDDA